MSHFQLSTIRDAQRRAWVEVDLEAVAWNIRALRQILSLRAELMAVVKADAYGHGAVAVSREALLAGASWLGVATVPEAIELREAGIAAPILVFGPVRDRYEIRELSPYNLSATVCDFDHARQLSSRTRTTGAPLEVHLKIDTGMSRLGTLSDDAVTLWRRTRELNSLSITGVYSHLATAEENDMAELQLQCRRFANALTSLVRPRERRLLTHLANTAATIRDPSTHYDMVRVGLGLYGFAPSRGLKGRISLKPALRVKARISQVKVIPPGTRISYGGQFIAQTPMRIAIVSIGYADGVSRGLSGQIEVLAHGQRAPQVGAITMDQLVVDVSHIPAIRPHDVVTLLGSDGAEEISVEVWAERTNSIVWEVLCGFKNRLPRVLTRGGYPTPLERTIQQTKTFHADRAIHLLQHDKPQAS